VALKWSTWSTQSNLHAAVLTKSGTLLHVFLSFILGSALGSARTLTAITRQCVTYLPKAPPQIVAQGLLNVLISVFFFFFFFWKMQYGWFSHSGSQMTQEHKWHRRAQVILCVISAKINTSCNSRASGVVNN